MSAAPPFSPALKRASERAREPEPPPSAGAAAGEAAGVELGGGWGWVGGEQASGRFGATSSLSFPPRGSASGPLCWSRPEGGGGRGGGRWISASTSCGTSPFPSFPPCWARTTPRSASTVAPPGPAWSPSTTRSSKPWIW